MAQKFTVEVPFWEIFPEVEIAVVEVHDVDNTSFDNIPDELLKNANQNALKWVPNDPISANEVIADWREAFQKFKTKKKVRCAVESLLKRAKKDNGVSSINPMVDVYNSVSLNWAFPLGGLDLDKVEGDVRLTVAEGGEKFWPISEDEGQEALTGEVVYTDDHSVLSRCWTWRDSARVQINEDTSNIIFYMENVNPSRKEEHEKAVAELQSKLKEYFDVDSTYWLVTKDNPSVELD